MGLIAGVIESVAPPEVTNRGCGAGEGLFCLEPNLCVPGGTGGTAEISEAPVYRV